MPRESNDITLIFQVILQEDGDMLSGQEGGVPRESSRTESDQERALICSFEF